MSPTVSIAIVTYNSGHVICDCLSSIAAILDRGGEIIVVDNDSTDDTCDLIEGRFPGVTLVRNSSNDGFASAVNVVALQAAGDVVVLLNPDVRASLDVLVQLSKLAVDNESVVGPVVRATDAAVATVGGGMFPTLWRTVLHCSGLAAFAPGSISWLRGWYIYGSKLHDLESLQPVDWVTGGCMVVPLPLWRELGGLSERWFMYAEDVEFCYRVRNAGHDVLLVTDLEVHHAIGGSSAGVDGRAGTAWLVNLYDFYEWRISSSRFCRMLWRATVRAGYAARLAAAKVAEKRDGQRYGGRTRQFEAYSAAAAALRERQSEKANV